ncbi:MAG: TonB-dependent receptor [Spirosomataceae bacterium]
MYKKILLLILLSSGVLFAQNTQTIRGKVSDIDSEKLLGGASISLVNTSLGTKSNENGEFIIEKVPVGRYQLQVTFVGYQTQKITELILESGKEMILDIKLKETSKELSEATVKAASNNISGALTSIQNITMEQVMRYPATFLDPARLATAFAGVANDNDQANGMVIRGNSPNGVQWRLEGVEIVNPNHLSNAGTFNDRATQNAGGVNILSAQLLGNMNFLTGAFPAEYGNATAGVMDMRLRKGNDQKHEFTAQAGIIGVDLATEGPLSKRSKASYLVNYRYSFTGLLSMMGIKFGDEDIRFQDLSFNLNFPTKGAGTFTIFGMGGVSSNVFNAKVDSLKEFEKDLQDITFENRMGAIGLTHNVKIGDNGNWYTSFALSSHESFRQSLINNRINDEDSIDDRKTAFYTAFTYRINPILRIKSGIYIDKSAQSVNPSIVAAGSNLRKYDADVFGIHPFANLNIAASPKLSFNAGLYLANYLQLYTTTSAEPRLSAQYKIGNRSSINLAYGLHSQMVLGTTNNLIKSHHLVLGNQINFKNNSYFKTELYYQSLFRIPIKSLTSSESLGYSYSLINLSNGPIPMMLSPNGTGENYGVELTYQQYITNGFYSLVNLSLYNSTYVAADGKKRDTRFNGNHIFNATIGKEWAKTRGRFWGINARINWLGGFRETPIDEAASARANTTIYDESKAWTVKQKDYFRPDVRVYFKKSKTKYSRMFSIDIQNVANYQNESFSYYDTFQKKVIRKYQLGMIPLINYRWEI